MAVVSRAEPPSLDGAIEGDLPGLLEAYRALHASPELSYREEKTSAYLAGQLRSLGYTVTEGLGKYDDPKRAPHGVVGVLKNGAGPTVLVRVEMDALPVTEKTGLPYASKVRVKNDAGEEVGVMHACGHDLHMVTFLGAAKRLAGSRDAWRGTLVLVGQPAEETGAGAEALLAGGLYARFPRPDFAIALHSDSSLEAGKVGVREGYVFAISQGVDVLVRGKGGHGALPQLTKDPVVLAAQIVLALQTIVSRESSPLEPSVVTVGAINGGTKGNVIPDEVRLQAYIRAYRPEEADRILASIARIAKGLAASAAVPGELSPVVNIKKRTPAVYNDPGLTARLAAALRKSLGTGAVVEAEKVMLGEDFSRYGLEGKIPISLLRLGAVDPEKLSQSRKSGLPLPTLHSSEFAPLPAPSILVGVKALVVSVLELMGR